MRLFLSLAAAGLLLSGANAAAATGTTKFTVPPGAKFIDCRIADPQAFTSSRIVLLYQPELKEMHVIDGAINEVYARPIEVDVSEDTPQHVVMSWVVKNLPGHTNNGQTVAADIKYNVIYVKASQSIIVVAQILAYDNRLYQSAGTCTVK
ncbi:MAG: hypothetical protein GC186_09375 [Rhodobacteraceae bacterium]|nr:hypothetical protein [Paracoccaceae bacterium]